MELVQKQNPDAVLLCSFMSTSDWNCVQEQNPEAILLIWAYTTQTELVQKQTTDAILLT